MEDQKNATHIEEVELLRLLNVNLRLDALTKERDAMVKTLGDKYGAFQTVQADGVHRAAARAAAVRSGRVLIMPTINTIDDVANIRSIGAAVTANAGAVAIQNVNGALKQVDDQGNAAYMGPTAFISNEIDFTVGTAQAWGSNWPVAPGYTFIATGAKVVVTSMSTTASAYGATNPTFTIGSTPGADNIVQSATASMSATTLNAVITKSAGATKNQTVSAGTAWRIDAPSPELNGYTPSVTCTILATATLKGKIVVFGDLAPWS